MNQKITNKEKNEAKMFYETINFTPKRLFLMLAMLVPATLSTACSNDDDADGGMSDSMDMMEDDATMEDEEMTTDDGEDMEPMPRGVDNPPTIGTQIDRVGRAAINTALNATFSADDTAKGEAKDAYNAATPDEWSSYQAEIRGNLAILDSLDANCGNQFLADQTENRYDFLAGVLADDQLYVNADSGTCGVYLGLEAEVVGAIPAGDGGCGGRTLNDDVIDRSYSLLAAGILTGVDDTITENDKTNSDTFPFLAMPH